LKAKHGGEKSLFYFARHIETLLRKQATDTYLYVTPCVAYIEHCPCRMPGYHTGNLLETTFLQSKIYDNNYTRIQYVNRVIIGHLSHRNWHIHNSVCRTIWNDMCDKRQEFRLHHNVIKANQNFMYRWLHAFAMFDVTSFPAFVVASDVILSVLSIPLCITSY